MIFRIILISFILFKSVSSFATHIVGGELMYRLLDRETNSYRITAQIFFDCENGNVNAIASDQTLYISQWDAKTKEFINDFTIPTFDQTQITKSEDYACINGPKDVCVSAYLYSKVVQIDPGENGVILAWQRCCRNKIIDNLIAPEATGFTAWTTIPPNTIDNSSPLFTDIPPIYICVDAPLDITQEAFDFDGDSLAYKMFSPFRGGARAPDERIRPSSFQWYDKPDFQNVFWSDGYTPEVPIPGNPSLNLNENTGRLTMTPNKTGVYVIGLLVEEWREGVLLNVTQRDYQISVIQCDFNILANYRIIGGDVENGIYSFGCSDTLRIKNLSYIKPGIKGKYFWDFGVPDIESDTLTTFDLNQMVEYIYPGNGDYTITLTVQSDVCEDEYEYQVRVRSSPPFDLGEDKVYCDDFVQQLVTRDPDAPDIRWNTGSRDFSIVVRDTGTYFATVSYGECSYSDTIYIGQDIIPDFTLLRDTLFCDDDIDLDVSLNMPNRPSNVKFQWTTSPSDTGISVNISRAGPYSVTASNGNCISTKDLSVRIAEKLDLKNEFYCNDFEHIASIDPFPEATYLWSNGEVGTSTVITTGGEYWVESRQRHCKIRDTFSISNPIIRLELGQDLHFCDSLSTTLDAGPDGSLFDWNSGQTTSSILVNQAGFYQVVVTDTHGCQARDSITISLSASPQFSLGNDTVICKNSPIRVEAPAGFEYEWDTGSEDQVIKVATEGNYSVKITDIFGCSGTDTLNVTVDEGALPNELFIPNSFTPNGDFLNEVFPFSEEVRQPEYYIIIFNRWGQKVFDSRTSDTQYWDGMFKGERASQSAYVYFAYYRGCDGNARTKKGTVTLLF